MVGGVSTHGYCLIVACSLHNMGNPQVICLVLVGGAVSVGCTSGLGNGCILISSLGFVVCDTFGGVVITLKLGIVRATLLS
jgi:hypothetical protein